MGSKSRAGFSELHVVSPPASGLALPSPDLISSDEREGVFFWIAYGNEKFGEVILGI